ncbi:tripartite motif-containing protein 16-like [Sebastes umbrosus]|uniref:tripartite motif-containing protein 16-like n=1 Tax=Sebastes umbrosus TaxID=72105 RepID=UPI00189FA2B5|nr:tripartite motif-containing protein 16-like [Sebastes umbrosus]
MAQQGVQLDRKTFCCLFCQDLLKDPPKTRAGFLRYSRDITLDPNTAQNWLSLSEGNRKVKWTGKGIYIAVAYKTISRDRWTGEDCTFGFNDKSWSLYCFEQKYGFIHNGTFTRISGPVSSGPLSSRVGVYLDHSAGILSFYNVSETMTLLHRVQTTFTEPLYAGLGPHRVSEGDTAEFCKLK